VAVAAVAVQALHQVQVDQVLLSLGIQSKKEKANEK
jgi:hypothetical protein